VKPDFYLGAVAVIWAPPSHELMYTSQMRKQRAKVAVPDLGEQALNLGVGRMAGNCGLKFWNKAFWM